MAAKIIPLNNHPEILSIEAQELANSHKAPLTLEAYKRCVERFEDWILETRRQISPVALAEFLNVLHKSDYALNTIVQYYSAVIDWDRRLKSLDVERVIGGIRRAHAQVLPKQTKALSLADAERVLSCLGDSLADCRNRAMLSVAWSTASRKSELLSLNVESILRDFGSLWIVVKEKRKITSRRKPIPGAVGDLSIPLAPSTHLVRWIEKSGITSGPLWRKINKSGVVEDKRLSRSGFDSIFKRIIKQSGLDPALYSPHSVRAGFVTYAAKNGYSVAATLAVTGHKDTNSLKHYWDTQEMLKEHPLLGGGKK